MLVRQRCVQWLWEWGSESRPLDHLRTCSCCPLSRESSGALGSGVKGCRKAVPVGGLGSGDAGAARGWDAPQGSLQAAEGNQLDASTARSQPLPFQAQSWMGTNNNPSLNSKFRSSSGQGGSAEGGDAGTPRADVIPCSQGQEKHNPVLFPTAEQRGKSPREDWEKGNNNNQPKELQTERGEGQK